jgi:hypothetical protein
VTAHVCVDCRALPTMPSGLAYEADAEWAPARPRPAPHGGPRSRRCTTHHRAHQKATRARRHDTRVTTIYNLNPGDYDRLYTAQGGRCAIAGCTATGKTKRLAVDHDHTTGEVRGLLCGPHNYDLLGRFVNALRPALDYLADPPARRILKESA